MVLVDPLSLQRGRPAKYYNGGSGGILKLRFVDYFKQLCWIVDIAVRSNFSVIRY